VRMTIVAAALMVAVGVQGVAAQDAASAKKEVSFKADVTPLVKKYCISCHAEEEYNPSEFSMDTYEITKKGGKRGPAWVAGKASESILVQKLWEKPPFGERMPLNSKKKIAAGTAKWMTPEEIRVFADWVDQGARNN